MTAVDEGKYLRRKKRIPHSLLAPSTRAKPFQKVLLSCQWLNGDEKGLFSILNLSTVSDESKRSRSLLGQRSRRQTVAVEDEN